MNEEVDHQSLPQVEFLSLQEIHVRLHLKHLTVVHSRTWHIVKSLRFLKCGGALPEVTVQTVWAGI